MGQALSIPDYIKRNWMVLKRSHRDLAAAAVDPKFPPFADGRWPVYVAGDEDFGRVERQPTARDARNRLVDRKSVV